MDTIITFILSIMFADYFQSANNVLSTLIVIFLPIFYHFPAVYYAISFLIQLDYYF